MTGLQLYLLITPIALLALAAAYTWWWVHHAPRETDGSSSKRARRGGRGRAAVALPRKAELETARDRNGAANGLRPLAARPEGAR